LNYRFTKNEDRNSELLNKYRGPHNFMEAAGAVEGGTEQAMKWWLAWRKRQWTSG